jgi:hypothetical protein
MHARRDSAMHRRFSPLTRGHVIAMHSCDRDRYRGFRGNANCRPVARSTESQPSRQRVASPGQTMRRPYGPADFHAIAIHIAATESPLRETVGDDSADAKALKISDSKRISSPINQEHSGGSRGRRGSCRTPRARRSVSRPAHVPPVQEMVGPSKRANTREGNRESGGSDHVLEVVDHHGLVARPTDPRVIPRKRGRAFGDASATRLRASKPVSRPDLRVWQMSGAPSSYATRRPRMRGRAKRMRASVAQADARGDCPALTTTHRILEQIRELLRCCGYAITLRPGIATVRDQAEHQASCTLARICATNL